MITLGTLKNDLRGRKQVRRVGRGIGSGVGKTCGRGQKGAGARSGYKRRLGYEGGQFRLFAKLPIRGFSNARFRKELDVVNLSQIEQAYQDGEVVNAETLASKGLLSGRTYGIKILGDGELTKKVSFEVHSLSATARDKLQKAKIKFQLSKS
ncbi:50S ribosomal protein L15 [Parachlamydia sp. AcF125]|uniref:50S ribosomal protein L15 n=1 Tax=Parachlamydia sp. AcF125 TaxID=2795736 RepID=UPI001BC9B775|nr:50S ribosomal protein L15 [Parachlamydia sp. AcF125]MBS4167437.1 50S ribosomal protein L15 [Parachlamydia sp. AcF125]